MKDIRKPKIVVLNDRIYLVQHKTDKTLLGAYQISGKSPTAGHFAEYISAIEEDKVCDIEYAPDTVSVIELDELQVIDWNTATARLGVANKNWQTQTKLKYYKSLF